jgi:hypothetical protein
MKNKQRLDKPVEIINIRKRTIRTIKLVEEEDAARSTILPIKNNKNKRPNVQREAEHCR